MKAEACALRLHRAWKAQSPLLPADKFFLPGNGAKRFEALPLNGVKKHRPAPFRPPSFSILSLVLFMILAARGDLERTVDLFTKHNPRKLVGKGHRRHG